MHPLVSVIIPNYNYAHFIPQRIGTVLGQTYRDIELIILDDASTDNSREAIEKYRGEDRVRHIVFNTSNSGSTFKQWEKGFQLAKGEYIWIAECDDYSDPSFLEQLMKVLEKDPDIKIAFSNSYWVTPESTFINKDYTIASPVKVYQGKDFVKKHLLKENYIYNASMAVFRKDALASVDKSFKDYRSCGDKVFWGSIAEKGKVAFVCKPLNYFRIHSGKVTTRSISSGLLFREEHRLFQLRQRQGYITWQNRYDVASYFLQYVKRMKDSFDNSQIYADCLRLWANELTPHNPALPLSHRVLCAIMNLLKKKP